jgi:hypothetical protein
MNEQEGSNNSRLISWAESTNDAASDIHRRLRQAAAVMAEFDLEAIRPVGDPPKGTADEKVARERLRADADTIGYENGKPRFTLRDPERYQTLRELGSREAMLEALRCNRTPDTPVQRALQRLIEGKDNNPQGQSADELAAKLAATKWLAGILPEIPDRIQLERSFARLEISQRIERLAVSTEFVDREAELHKLRNRFEERGEAPPILVHGAGGVGKSTLVAKALWEEVQAGAVVAWLDFDRTILDPRRPLTVLIEAARQFASLVPEAADGLLRLREKASKWLLEAALPIGKLADRFGNELSRLLRQSRIVLVLDTFEEVQVFGPDTEAQLIELSVRLQRSVSGLVIVICGRAPASAEGLECLPVLDLPLTDAERLLRLLVGVESGEEAEALGKLAKELGGNPLVLRLAARVISAEGAGSLLSHTGLDAVRTAIRAERLEGMLYGRILSHIRSDSARRVAFPGLVVRLITPAVIREVLAGPCRIDLNRTPAEAIYEDFEKEVALVAPDPVSIGLRHRPDVRRLMLADILAFVSADDVAAINRAAVRYWTDQEGATARAEEIYHRLHLGQDREVLDSRWDAMAAPLLEDALQELPPTQRLWLADRLGATVEPSLRQEADLQAWEADAARAAQRRLGTDDYTGALAILQERRDRSPGSPVHLVTMRALWMLGRLDEALGIADGEAPRDLAAGKTSCAVELWLTAALIAESHGDLEIAFQKAEAAAGAGVALTDTSFKLRTLTTRVRLLRKLGKDSEAERRELRRGVSLLMPPETLQKPQLDLGLLRQIVAEVGDDDAELLKLGIANLGLDTHTVVERRRLAAALAELTEGPSTVELWPITHSGEALTTYVSERLQQAPVGSKVLRAFAQFFRATVDTNIERAWEDWSSALIWGEPSWSAIDSNLADAYRDHVRGNHNENLERAIELYTATLQIQTREASPVERALTQANLASAYRERVVGNRADNVELAIRHYEAALEVLTREAFPQQWAAIQGGLADAYRERIRGERAENLERAITLYGAALQVLTQEFSPGERALARLGLAEAYRQRVGGYRNENLERAIELYTATLQVQTREASPVEWALSVANLASAYRERVLGERAYNMELAIRHYEAALQVLTREAFPQQWAAIQSRLADTRGARHRGDRADNVERAIMHYELALQVITREASPLVWAATQRSLADAYRERIRGDRAHNVNRAIALYQAALQVFTREAFPAECRKTMSYLGYLHFERNDWAAAHAAFSEAFGAGEDLFAQAFTEPIGRSEATENIRLYAAYAYCLLRLGRPAEALLTMDRGNSRVVYELLALGELDFASLPEPDRAALAAARQVRRELDAEMRLPRFLGEQGEHELSESLRRSNSDLDRVIGEIRAARPDFMSTDVGLPELLDLIPDGGALVSFLSTAKGGAAIVMPHGAARVISIWLEGFAEADALALLRGPEQLPALNLGLLPTRSDRPTGLYAVESIGESLWERLVGPIHDCLAAFGLTAGAPVLLIPQSGLGLLQLHAAWRNVDGHPRYFLDDYTLAYAPSGYTVIQTRRRQREAARLQPERSLLAVIDPTGDLPFARAEGRAVAAFFADSEILIGDMVTLDAVLVAAPKHGYLHFACSLDDLGALILAGTQRLTLAEIASRLELPNAQLVVLSFANSGLADAVGLSDEWIRLPTGFLRAGARGVLAKLWEVDELSTRLLVERFYREHLTGLAPATALRSAQQWLRNAPAEELNLADQLGEVYQRSLDARRTQALAAQRYYMRRPQERPFSHPYYWAPFILIGA